MNDWLTTAQAAARLGISPHTLRAYASRSQTRMRYERRTETGMVRLYWDPADVEAVRVGRDEQRQVNGSAKLLAARAGASV